jgi:hypothetical protein
LALGFLGRWSFFLSVATVAVFVIIDRKKITPAYRGLDLVALWFLAPIILVATIPSLFGVSLFQDRFALPAVPAAVLLVAWLLGLVKKTAWSRWAPLTVFLTVSFFTQLMPAVRSTATFADRLDEGWNKAAGFLERNAEDDDLILFGTGFIEADYLSIEPDPVVFSFLRWPLVANLSSTAKYKIVALSRNEIVTPYMDTVLKNAAENRRVWVIGKGRVIDTTAQVLVNQKRFWTRERELYGNVHVILLER